MNKLDIAKKLAAITGKPIEEFFDGNIQTQEEKVADEQQGSRPAIQAAQDVDEVESDRSTYNTEHSSPKKESLSKEILEYQKMFKGSKILNGKKIVNGRQMTKQEYNKFSKGLTLEELFAHPLHYKMFRAEGQNEVFYPRWLEKFQ